LIKLTSNPPLSLYIHLPWCEQKCPYCDFNSHSAHNMDERAYIRALVEDLQQELPLIWGRQIDSIFIGGGTPSLFSAAAIQQLLSELRALLNFSPAIEITMEANPGSADESRFAGYRAASVNRLSIGIQSFDSGSLKRIGRIHDGAQSLAAIQKARAAGFDNINLDLIFALPAQSLELALADIEQAIVLEPQHISHYQLTIEPNTLFHSQTPERLPDDDSAWEMQLQAQQQLNAAGYGQYEISAFAKPGRPSRHNLNYWQFGDYLGIGAGAHGKISLPGEGRIIRRSRTRQPEAYLKQTAEQRISQQSELNDQDLVFEFMLNALRLVEGFPLTLFNERCGLAQTVLQKPLQQAQQLELITLQNGWIKPTPRGLQFHNDLQAIFLDVEIDNTHSVNPAINF
jgi:oxygen-independent coproporphyrinogen-3 oxidase